MLGIIGREVGNRWEQWRDYLHYGDYVVVAAVVALVIYLLVRRRRGTRRTGPRPSRPPKSARRFALSPARAAALGLIQGQPSCCRCPVPPT